MTSNELIDKIAPWHMWVVCRAGHMTCPGHDRPRRCIRHDGQPTRCQEPVVWVRDVPALEAAVRLALAALSEGDVRKMLSDLKVFG